MSTSPDKKTSLAIAITVFTLFSILPQVSVSTATDTQNKQTVQEPRQTSLSKEQAISLANQEAVRKGYDLSEYERPRADYEILKKDRTWTVFYEGKKKLPGNHFLVWVNDQTKECKLMRGE